MAVSHRQGCEGETGLLSGYCRMKSDPHRLLFFIDPGVAEMQIRPFLTLTS